MHVHTLTSDQETNSQPNCLHAAANGATTCQASPARSGKRVESTRVGGGSAKPKKTQPITNGAAHAPKTHPGQTGGRHAISCTPHRAPPPRSQAMRTHVQQNEARKARPPCPPHLIMRVLSPYPYRPLSPPPPAHRHRRHRHRPPGPLHPTWPLPHLWRPPWRA